MSAEKNDSAKVLERLIRLCDDLAWGRPADENALFELTKTGASTPELERLAEAFGMMTVKVEAREFQRAPYEASAFREAEYAFNRIFVGPGHVPAPPYASVYLDAEPLLMGRAAVSMRDLFRSMGLAVREEDNLPEDHLACELEAWLVLRSLASADDGALRRSADEALLWLLDGHMQIWIPEFLSRARAESMPEPLSDALDCLEAWLLSAQNALNRE